MQTSRLSVCPMVIGVEYFETIFIDAFCMAKAQPQGPNHKSP